VHKFAKYHLRYFFDVWSGDCLWAANDAAHKRFGYPVFLQDLGLSDETLQLGRMIIERLQNDVAFESLGYEIEPYVQFADDSSAFLVRLREELGPSFEILDERFITS
jgi:hypothetical protein